MVRTVLQAIRLRGRLFAVVAVGVLLLNVALPPLVLSVARKPPDHFSFNPWLRNLPGWLASEEATWARKAEFLWNAALYWFIASGPYDAAEWGYTATVRDVARWIVLSLLFATYFALWSFRAAQLRSCGIRATGAAVGQQAGVTGALLSTLGFSTLPCSVVGCGAPVLPVVGLALSGLGLSSETLAVINRTSRAVSLLVYALLLAGIVYLARSASAVPDRREPGP